MSSPWLTLPSPGMGLVVSVQRRRVHVAQRGRVQLIDKYAVRGLLGDQDTQTLREAIDDQIHNALPVDLEGHGLLNNLRDPMLNLD